MAIHRFAVNTGQVSADQFDTILTSFRSDVEQRHTPLALHDPGSADVRMARAQAREQINISGAEVVVYLRTENADFDHVWDASIQYHLCKAGFPSR